MTKGIVVSFDRLALRMLGCYGSEWVETPNLDRLAVSSMVFDRHFAENVGSAAANHAWWSGCYQFPRTSQQQQQQKKLAETLQENGVQTTLLLEKTPTGESAERHTGRSLQGFESQVVPSTQTGFQHIIDVAGADGLDVPPAETPFARLVTRGIEELNALKEQGSESWLLWLKSAGVPAPWIPPKDFAELYLDLFEEETPGSGDAEQYVDLSEEALDELITAVASMTLRAVGWAKSSYIPKRRLSRIYMVI